MSKTRFLKRVLVCKPLHYSVDYVINPWMKIGSVNQKKAVRQWESLVKALQGLEVEVNVINQQKGLPDMVFSADQGVVKGKDILMSNFRYEVRRGERCPYLEWFKNRNFQAKFLPTNYFFEGGDALLFKNLIFMGMGFRTTEVSCKKIALALDTEVVSLRLVNPRFYHLDMCLLPLDTKTAFYYAKAFSPDSLEKLKRVIPRLIPLSDKEAYGFSANSVVTDHHVVIQKNNLSFKEKLNNLGYHSVEVDLGEFMKGGGGIHCLTQVLSEEYD
jgi:N-dimethylarginine dimethylaminohydrolase